jgi:hypothetical protein
MVTPAAVIQLVTAALTQMALELSVHGRPSDHIGDHPMLFSLLEAFHGQLGYLCPSQTASQQNSTIA